MAMEGDEKLSLLRNRKSTQPELTYAPQAEITSVHMIKTTILKE